MQDSTYTHEWNPPLSLEGVPLLPWPKDVFPEPIEEFVKELSRSTETPIELSAMIMLAIVAAAAQKKYLIQIKPDYCEPVNIWSVVVLPPASRKSRIYAEITQPLRKWELEQKQIFEPLIQSAISQNKTIEARLKELRIKASKAKHDVEFQACQNDIEGLERKIPQIPTIPQIWTSDITPEHLGTIMAMNDEAMAVISDEGGIFDILGGLYSDGRANIDLFLQSHSGGPTKIERGSRPTVFMQNALLTMGLTVQPEVIHSICKNKKFRGKGLLARFLYVIPNSNIGTRTFEEHPMNKQLSQHFQSMLWSILNHKKAQEEGSNGKHVLYLEPNAYQKWLDYAKAVEVMMSDKLNYLNHITDWAGKLPGAIARIAALLHTLRYSNGKPWTHKVSYDDMTSAVKIGHILINHALRVFDLFHETTTMQIARIIYNWIKEEKPSSFTQRDCLRKFRRFKKPELRPALDVLVEQEILRERESSKLGRPSNIFDVNSYVNGPKD